MSSNTRIYDRFEHWSVEDCDCKYCRFFPGKGKLCPLDSCPIDDIRQEAIRREAVEHAHMNNTQK